MTLLEGCLLCFACGFFGAISTALPGYIEGVQQFGWLWLFRSSTVNVANAQAKGL